MARDPNDLFEIHGIDINQDDPNDLFQQQQRQQPQQQQQQQQDFMRRMQNSFSGGVYTGGINNALGYLNQAAEAPRGIATLLSDPSGINEILGQPTLGSLMPELPKLKISAPENPTTGYKAGNFLGEYGDLLYGGARLLPYVAKGIGKIMPKVSNAVVAGIRPTKTWKSLYNQYSDKSINPIVEKGMEKYESNIDKFGDEKFAYFPEFLEAKKDVETFGSTKVKKYLEILSEKPTIRNASKLKKQLNDEIYKPSTFTDTLGDDRIASYENLKKELKPSLAKSLTMKNKRAGQEFLDAEKYWASSVHPELTVSQKLKEMSHKTDLFSKAGANRAAETILKEHFNNPKNISKKAVVQAEKIAQQIRNLDLLKNLSISAGIGGGGVFGVKQIKNLFSGGR
jgi:hypothetical protein